VNLRAYYFFTQKLKGAKIKMNNVNLLFYRCSTNGWELRVTILNYYLMLKLYIIFICFLFVSCSTTGKITEEPGITGKTNWIDWQQKSGWKNFEPKNFEPSTDKIKKLSILTSDDYTFIIFATTFCEECKEQLPKIFKIFNLAKINFNNIILIGLDKNLKEPTGFYKKFDIPTTPVLFILKNNTEIGYVSSQDELWLDGIIEILKR
jgi:hypothetical protein